MGFDTGKLSELASKLDGEIRIDTISKIIYSTDASAYKEVPSGVIYPRSAGDLKKITAFASDHKIPVTVRAAGTSLAGQVVTGGLIIDISRYLNRIIEVNKEERWVRVEPGVVLDELNIFLRSSGLFFGPETSTSNRCNIGGMVGNNACGSHSLVYGSTRDHIIELRAILTDGSEVLFRDLNKDEFEDKCRENSLEGDIYRNIRTILTDPSNRENIEKEYPDPEIKRRNTGYAIDRLADSNVFSPLSTRPFNMSDIIAGSEGTLAIVTEIKLNLVPLPPVNKALVCVHLKERNDSFRANLLALKYDPCAVELMDDRILSLTRDNISQRRNRFFVEGEPGALLIVEFVREDVKILDRDISLMISDMKVNGFGYAYPVIKGKDIARVWELRKAGLGVLSNMKGDSKPVSLIEDTAVNVKLLPDYMKEVEAMLAGFGKEAVYHAHIGTGELHIRPVLNLKDENDVRMFREIGEATAHLVKKYRGSMSGEHGDGRLRAEFIPIVIGKENFRLLGEIKKAWDPDNIFNPGKITGSLPMNSHLRYLPGQSTPVIETYYDFSSTLGILRAAENCNGSGDCRKSEITGGLMCPSYMATRDEKNTTRARANILREFLGKKGDPWNHPEIYEILDLCLSCKGCKSECPSNVDIAKLKSEFLQHWYEQHRIPVRTLLIAWLPYLNGIGSLAPPVYNYVLKNKVLSGLIKSFTGFASDRSVPLIGRITLRGWLKKNLKKINPSSPISSVCLFVDEFTNYNDTETGIKTVKLLTALNYRVITVDHGPSGRTFISKGLLKRARKLVRINISILKDIINKDVPLIGIEPSAILGFRDEYPDLAGKDLHEAAINIASNSFLIDEFIARELDAGRIDRDLFTNAETEVLVHTHCQQKAVASSASLVKALSAPANYRVREIPSGCCGMAGSFGYEKEHFELSNRIGELVLFPEIRKAARESLIAAPGTSCRHHISDGTGRQALHPADILYEALVGKQ